MNWWHLFFSFDGRITRQDFWLGMALIAGVELLVMVPAASQGAVDLSAGQIPLWFRNLSLGLDILLAWPLAAVLVKRLQDRDQPPVIALYAVGLLLLYSALDAFGLLTQEREASLLAYIIGLPLLAVFVVVIVELGMRRGTEGPNRFGPDPL